ncbi:MAG TPA: patatin-like phospholipase family protein [Anaeromyxobacteraceae bacterium]|nr:patatin-like phospholipase family protein [Anaeromyxobacteraceae bacterium]
MVHASRLPAALALAAALTACRSVPTLPPRSLPQTSRDAARPRVALVLGGGAARGFAHVGVLHVLEDAGIPVDLIVGTSAGSLVGALYADGYGAPELERLSRDLDRDAFFDFSLAPALFGTGLARGARLERWVRDHLRSQRIEELAIPYAAVATDLDDGSVVVLDRGEVATAVRASSAVPGVFEPVQLGQRLLVDGGVVANLPVKVARARGADVVIAVDVTALSGKAKPSSFVEVVMRAVIIMTHEGVEEAARAADVLVAPAVGDVDLLDFGAKDRAIAAGAAAAREKLPEIRRAVEGPRSSRWPHQDVAPVDTKRSAGRSSLQDGRGRARRRPGRRDVRRAGRPEEIALAR